jgi:hypothetical protein
LQITANVSGGHLNPAVGAWSTVATCCSCTKQCHSVLSSCTPAAGDLRHNDHGEPWAACSARSAFDDSDRKRVISLLPELKMTDAECPCTRGTSRSSRASCTGWLRSQAALLARCLRQVAAHRAAHHARGDRVNSIMLRRMTMRTHHAVLLQVGLKPGLAVGTEAVACFVPGTGVSKAQSFGWCVDKSLDS